MYSKSKSEIKSMQQEEAGEIADSWKYDGVYKFYDMTEDPEDYNEIVSSELRGNRYYSVFEEGVLTGFFCVERIGADIEIGLGLRPDLTGNGRGKRFVEEILCFLRECFSFQKILLEVASFNQRAIKVYERVGFVKSGVCTVSTNGGIYDFTLMELDK